MGIKEQIQKLLHHDAMSRQNAELQERIAQVESQLAQARISAMSNGNTMTQSPSFKDTVEWIENTMNKIWTVYPPGNHTGYYKLIKIDKMSFSYRDGCLNDSKVRKGPRDTFQIITCMWNDFYANSFFSATNEYFAQVTAGTRKPRAVLVQCSDGTTGNNYYIHFNLPRRDEDLAGRLANAFNHMLPLCGITQSVPF